MKSLCWLASGSRDPFAWHLCLSGERHLQEDPSPSDHTGTPHLFTSHQAGVCDVARDRCLQQTLLAEFLVLFFSCGRLAQNSVWLDGLTWTMYFLTLNDELCWLCRLLELLSRSLLFSKASTDMEGRWVPLFFTHPLPPRVRVHRRPYLLPDPTYLLWVWPASQLSNPEMGLVPPAGVNVTYFLWEWDDENLHNRWTSLP